MRALWGMEKWLTEMFKNLAILRLFYDDEEDRNLLQAFGITKI
jgi:hypothetical protein